MRRTLLLQRGLVVLAILGAMNPEPGLAGIHDEFPRESSRASGPEVRDVQLSREHTLTGVLVDAQGRPTANAEITIRMATGPGRRIVTNSQGHFRFGPLRGGVYQLNAGHGALFVRAWKHSTAPPKAPSVVVLSSNAPVLRGQGPLSELLTYDPVLFGIIIAAAIAIPVAVHNSKSAS